MLNFRSMAKTASKRKATLVARISATKETLAGFEKELAMLDSLLAALPAGRMSRGPGRPPKAAKKRKGGKRMGGKRKGGKWKLGKPGRPPKWFLEQQKGKAKKPAKSGGGPKPKKKRIASPKMLAALAKARAARAAKRAAAGAGAPTGSSPE